MAEINFDDIPEQFRSMFVERDGQYTIDTQKISEFSKNSEDVRRALSARDNEKANAEKFRRQLEELQQQMGGVDLSRVPDLLKAQEKIEELEHQQLIAEKKFEEAAEKKFQRQLAEMQRQMEALKTSITDHQTKYERAMQDLEESKISTQLTHELINAGVNPQMIPFILEKERKAWELDPETREPVPITYLENGKNKVTAMGVDGKPLTFKGHANTFLQDNPWAAMASNGSQATHQQQRSGNGSFTIRRDEVKADVRKYEALKEQAQKVGAQVTIVE